MLKRPTPQSFPFLLAAPPTLSRGRAGGAAALLHTGHRVLLAATGLLVPAHVDASTAFGLDLDTVVLGAVSGDAERDAVDGHGDVVAARGGLGFAGG